jgi:hypothetical protein
VNRLWLFLHLLGFTAWLGGGLASMFIGIAAKREDRTALGAVVRGQAAVHRSLVFPGALLATLSGVILSFRVAYAGANSWLVLMQGTGIVAALLTLFVTVPTMARLGRLDPMGEGARFFDELRARHSLVSSIAGTLALVALFAGAALRYG